MMRMFAVFLPKKSTMSSGNVLQLSDVARDIASGSYFGSRTYNAICAKEEQGSADYKKYSYRLSQKTVSANCYVIRGWGHRRLPTALVHRKGRSPFLCIKGESPFLGIRLPFVSLATTAMIHISYSNEDFELALRRRGRISPAALIRQRQQLSRRNASS
uniref:Uncharacterized protein n=1 Tax=Steinernema glaseri TaxID=37863 RepID=A0A1I7YYT4_9BILA